MTHDDRLRAHQDAAYRTWAIQMLNRPKWPSWGSGDLCCPVCGATVHPSMRDLHAGYHEATLPDPGDTK